ncbi:hypothetical protein [Companilactobacillus muriivasis]|uniref:hypothetical protein n=1 Tax=Companilactobacillus muriivasis TaxID=3081444 RepID=UPI0030C75011
MKLKKTLFIIPMILLLVLVGTACSASNSSSNSSSSSKKTTSSTSFKKTNTNDSKADSSLSSVTSSVESKFKQLSYTDKKTGVTLSYALYVPKNYNKKTAYPMLTFIPDDSVTGQSTATGITQGYGGSIWATDSEQKKHASFVLIPVFDTSTVSGGFGQFGSSAVKTNANFITWKSGTVLENSNKGMEHMASFDCGYTIPAVRDWLFNQSK